MWKKNLTYSTFQKKKKPTYIPTEASTSMTTAHTHTHSSFSVPPTPIHLSLFYNARLADLQPIQIQVICEAVLQS